MKKRIFVSFLLLTVGLFHFSIPNIVFGKSSDELLKELGLDGYLGTFKHLDVHEHFPAVLEVFRSDRNQGVLNSNLINNIAKDPRYLWVFAPNADDKIVAFLAVDEEFEGLFRNPQFHAVLQDPNKINTLVGAINGLTPNPRDTTCPLPPQPEFPRATSLRIVSGNNQSGETGKSLAQPFVVGVLDQEGKPLQKTAVTFTVTAGNGRLSATRQMTDVYGQARTTLTLGSRAGRHSVMARAAGITQTQTFTATATAPPPSPKPEPVVPVPPSTSEPSLPPMYWIEGNTIYYRPTGGRKTVFNAPQDGTLTGGLAVDTTIDTKGKKVYWTEQTNHNMGRIQSADLDGSNVKTVQNISTVPRSIAFDTKDKMLYWTNSRGRIQRIKVGGNRVENFRENVNNPKHIAFDVKNRRLHWTDAEGIWNIYSDNDTGTPRRLGTEDLGEVRGIAVYDDVVYWTEQTNGSGSVRFMNRNGSGDKKLLASELLASLEEIIPGGIAVDAIGRKVYWTTSHGIRSAPLTGETVVISKEEPAGIALGGTAAPGAPMAPSVSPVVSVENTLLANYPNPFNPETWIPYQLSASADVSVSIYSVNGHLVRRLDLGHQAAGVYRSRSRAAYWDGRNAFGERVASGLYFYTLTAGDFTATRKMLIRK